MSEADSTQNTALGSTYVHLKDDLSASLVPVTDSFWPELTSGQRPELYSGRLVTQFDFSSDWPTWEMHPAGDELVVLLHGSVELLLEVNGEQQSHRLTKPGEFVLVPPNTWHTARVTEPCSMLFVTPGEGTQNRER